MDYHTLLKQLHKGEVHEIYFFYGEEKLLQDQALKALEKQILPEGLEDFNKDIVSQTDCRDGDESALYGRTPIADCTSAVAIFVYPQKR